MESVVVLCNHLRQMMVRQCHARPSLATLNKTFAAYQKDRQPRMQHIMEYSGLITHVQAWSNPLYKFVATWVLPLQPDRAVADQLGEIIRDAPKLDFVDVEGFASGRLPWKDDSRNMEKQKTRSRLRKDGLNRRLALLWQTMSAAVVIGIFVFAARYLRLLSTV